MRPQEETFMRRITALLAAATIFVLVVLAAPAHATFPGRNGLIVFGAETRHSGYELFTVQPDGRDLTRLTHLDGDAVQPDWSPDATQIVFELDHVDGPVFCSIELMDVNTGDIADLTTARNPSGWSGCENQPSFTPDGTRTVFVHFDDTTGVESIWSMNLTGANRVEISNGTGHGVTDPNVSPDGSTVSFIAGNGKDLGQALMTSAIDGTNVQRIVPFRLDVAVKHDWAPDGQHIVFTDNADRFTKPANIATVAPDGGDLMYLTHFRKPTHRAYVGGYSPNGRWIVFRIEIGDRSGLFRMHPDGSAVKTIIPMSAFRPRFTDWGTAAAA
jgi:Tol biopolymer transport system component